MTRAGRRAVLNVDLDGVFFCAREALDLHLSRLAAAHREVYGRALGGQEVRARIRHALGARGDAGGWAPVSRVDDPSMRSSRLATN